MSKRNKYTPEEKYEILKSYESGAGSIEEIATKYMISIDTFYHWRYKYMRYGINGLIDSGTCKKYSKELKDQAIKDYVSGKYSLREVAKKYELTNKSVLQRWLKKYNGHREITSTTKRMSESMTIGRTTCWKERIKITLYCINHNKDYKYTAEVFKVSYQQVYQWVKKYESGGEDALKDGRGRKKPEEQLTQEEKVKIEMKKLELENERLRAENLFLKKLEELERRRF